MKFMKLGTRPDTFHTEEATRTVISDIPPDLVIKVENVSYALHKFPLVPKCGRLQRLCAEWSADSERVELELDGIPGGEAGFELCAKFCYGITINLSAHNFLHAFCAAVFLGMAESVEKGNLVAKLDAFFHSCILLGWKDSIAALQSTLKLADASDNLGVTRKCVDSVVEKILTPPPKVSWSYTYTRPGYSKKHPNSTPKDWWTEDIADLDVELFRCIITGVRSTYILPSQLIGEALHVYACRCLPMSNMRTNASNSFSSKTTAQDPDPETSRRVLETIVSLIPPDRGSVSVGFLLSLLSTANRMGNVSPVTKTELLRRSSLQFDEATVSDLLFPTQSTSKEEPLYDVDLVSAVLESFLMIWRRQSVPVGNSRQVLIRSMENVGKLIDSYLQVVARDSTLTASKLVCLAEALPDVARTQHDDLYKAINIFLKEHPELSKAEKKRVCRILDCQKLSAGVRAHAVKNERLPLRTVVQVLFFEQERSPSSRPPPTQQQEESRPPVETEPAPAPSSKVNMSTKMVSTLSFSESTEKSRQSEYHSHSHRGVKMGAGPELRGGGEIEEEEEVESGRRKESKSGILRGRRTGEGGEDRRGR